MSVFKDKFGKKFTCDFNFKGCNTLVLSGGAFKSIYFLGALVRIKNFSNLKYFCGTSAGAMVSALIAIGYTPIDIFKRLYRERVNIYNVTSTLDVAIARMEQMFEEKGISKDISFIDFEKVTKKKLAFVSSNVSKMREEIFSSLSYPNIPLIYAVKLSCSLPIIFPTSKLNDDIFIDGIFFDNFPIKLCKLFPNHKQVLCITTTSSHYDKRICNYYSRSGTYKIIIIPDLKHKYFCLTQKDKFYMYITGYNFVHENIVACNGAIRKRKRRKSI